MKLTERQTEERRRHVSNALASQRLEGVKPDPETIADLERYAVGELEIDAVIDRLKARFPAAS